MAVEIPKPPRQSPVFAANTLAPGDVRGVAVQHLESGPELRQTPAAGMTACQIERQRISFVACAVVAAAFRGVRFLG